MRLESTKKENTQSSQIKKPSISNQAFQLLNQGKKLIDVTIELNIPPKKANKLWFQFLKLTGKDECYELYEVCRYDIPHLLSINSFLERNNIDARNIANVLKLANDTSNLQSQYTNLKNQVEKLKQQIMEYNLRLFPPLQPLPRNIRNYSYF